MIVVGMDVHVRNSYLYATDADGRRLHHGRCANTPEAFEAFFADVLQRIGGEAVPMRAVLESTTNSRAIQRMMVEAAAPLSDGAQVDVLNARKLRIIAESVCKCDALDARVLNELARSNLRLPTCYIPDDEEFALREHLRARADLVRLRTALKNRIHAVLHRRGILSPARSLFTREGRRFLEQVALDEAGRAILDRYLSALDAQQALIKASDADLDAAARRPRWAKSMALLQTMPGIGRLTALTLLAELGDLKRFRNRAAVSNYAGLVPIIRDSNTKHYAGGISHRGSSHLRAVLVEAAWTAVGRVPVYGDLYERVAGRRGKPVAIVAVARRMLEDAVRMLWKQEAFRYVSPASRRKDTSCANETIASSVAG